MAVGDLVVVPLKNSPSIQIGEIAGDYVFEPGGPSPYYHWRSVKWVGEAIPRSNFGQDLLYSFGAFMTICRISRNNAEARIAKMRASGWAPEKAGGPTPTPLPDGEPSEMTDISLLAQDQIASLISAHFKGHNLTRLVDAVLRAQGYTTWVSPEGPDGGVDILAGSGPLGFGSPKLAVEVKSEETPIDRSTVDKLLGAVSKFGADEGLFVAWGGFKSTVQKELAGSFFKVRLWSRSDFLEQLFETYDRLDDDIRAELPLKRIWTVAVQDEG
jgi:restriction system protein